MIIVSQDKDLIVNFDNVEAIILGNPIKDEHGFCKIIALVTSNNNCTLGKYTTEERAKEVLQEIVIVYEYGKRHLADSNDTSPFDEVFVYKMPLEEE